MPHVALVPLTGLRVAEQEMLAFGMSLPGFRERASAISELPSLGLLTLAGMLPENWSCSYHPSVNLRICYKRCLILPQAWLP